MNTNEAATIPDYATALKAKGLSVTTDPHSLVVVDRLGEAHTLTLELSSVTVRDASGAVWLAGDTKGVMPGLVASMVAQRGAP